MLKSCQFKSWPRIPLLAFIGRAPLLSHSPTKHSYIKSSFHDTRQDTQVQHMSYNIILSSSQSITTTYHHFKRNMLSHQHNTTLYSITLIPLEHLHIIASHKLYIQLHIELYIQPHMCIIIQQYNNIHIMPFMASIHNNTTNNHLHQRWIKPTNNNYINTKRLSHLTIFQSHNQHYSIPY